MSNLLSEIRRIQEMINNGISDKQITDVINFFKTAPTELLQKEPYKTVYEYLKNNNSISDGGNEIPAQTSDDDFYKAILTCLGAPITNNNMRFFYAWRQAEGGKATFNPFNTTMKMEGATPYNNNPDGVKNYKTREEGINATCKTLKLSYYSNILNQLRNGNVDPLTIASNKDELNTWGTGDLLAKVAKSYQDGNAPKPHPIATA